MYIEFKRVWSSRPSTFPTKLVVDFPMTKYKGKKLFSGTQGYFVRKRWGVGLQRPSGVTHKVYVWVDKIVRSGTIDLKYLYIKKGVHCQEFIVRIYS